MPEPLTSTDPRTPPVELDPASSSPEAAPGPGKLACLAPQSTGAEQLLADASGAVAQRYVDNSSEAGSDVEGRRAQTPMQLGYADAGITEDGGSAYAEGALLFGSKFDTELSIGLASLQVGEQSEAQTTLFAESSHGDDGTTTTFRDMSLIIGGGVHNSDGSIGLNLKADASILTAEVDQDLGDGNRISVGVHVGAGVGGSLGTSDIDGDGHTEYCMRVSAFGMTAGGCLELGQVAEAALDYAHDALETE
jgi:hypothetical protein